MKEASGEANMTVITIVLITAIAAVVTPIVINSMNTAGRKAECSNQGGYWEGDKCIGPNGSEITIES